MVEVKSNSPTRFRKARNDASIHNIIEVRCGLLVGSVKLVNLNGRKIRSDATVGALVSRWE